VIDKLQHYLQTKGWKWEKKVTLESGETTIEQVPYPFFKWLETHYTQYLEPGELWQKMIESLQTRYNGQRQRVTANISSFTQNGYIKAQFDSAIL